jgi:hypothetical protein
LLKSLSGAKKPDEVIRLIETQFDADPHCGSALFRRWGVNANLKRYKFKNCARTYNALTCTPLNLNRNDLQAWLADVLGRIAGDLRPFSHPVRG